MDSSTLLTQSTRALFEPYPKALGGGERGVHKLRVAVRKLRVALALLAEKPDGKQRRRADKLLRSIGKAVSASRDLDVGVALIDSYPPRRAAEQPEWLELKRAMLRARTRARRQSRDRLLDLDVAALRRALRKLAPGSALDAAEIEARLRAHAQSEAAELLERLAAARRRFDAERLHQARRRIRRLRYASELENTLSGRESDTMDRWKTLQSPIGDIHDRHVLAAWLEKRAAWTSRTGRASAARLATSLRARVVRDERRIYRELMGSDPEGQVRALLDSAPPPEGP